MVRLHSLRRFKELYKKMKRDYIKGMNGMRIKVKIKKAKKSTRILALIALIGLFVTDMIGNLYLSAGAVLFALALIAAVITDMVGSFIKSWREKRE